MMPLSTSFQFYVSLTRVFIHLFQRFKVTDLSGLNKFRVSLIVSVCFESGSACEVEQTILNEAILPKPQCDLNIGSQGQGKVNIECILFLLL